MVDDLLLRLDLMDHILPVEVIWGLEGVLLTIWCHITCLSVEGASRGSWRGFRRSV